MSFARVNPSGWALNDPFTPAQMNQLDINVSRAIDGYAGGAYSPSAVIDIQGANGLQVEKLVLPGTTWPSFASRSVTRAQGLKLVFASSLSGNFSYGWINNAPADWSFRSDPGAGTIGQIYVDTSGSPQIPQVWFELIDYPQGAILESAAIDVYHATAGADAATLPKAEVWYRTYTLDGAPSLTQLGSPVDIETTYRQKTKRITVPFTPFAPAVGEQVRLFIALFGEGGSGAAAGISAMQSFLTFTHTNLRF